MAENKRFMLDDCGELIDLNNHKFVDYGDEVCNLLNDLAEENQFLKEKEKDMLDYLKKEYDFIYKQRMKHLDDAILVTSYDLIKYHIRSMIEHLEGL